ncbi:MULTISPECIES: DUF2759 domain-containing protein [Bacillaceae]|jgi:hypothetical protein|uniref:DUF2759 domain-containing protein n=1 Tax=Gottfriedia luciferensis TaxID=178774 RepID=A0ABX2ZNN4_9BACI|nr:MULTISPECIES: DUF2759 domain-containing protein [Bacillaceae]ODG91340.1 DUF2759 domain-containing protein [Gottfriedia luciferensis]PGZ92005.1 DUF2759 domain-containing protein [Bacillus sp. AFS029533]SFD57193.1 Protein of unknown function [Bacillus sp. UNCCL81]
MGTVIIFILVAILSVPALLGSLKKKNFLAVFWSAATLVLFGWFAIMTILHNGYPPAHL